LVYLLPFAVFGAHLRDGSDELLVEQYTVTTISYKQVRACFGLYLVPFQFVIVLTRRGFPLNILLSGDVFVGGKNGLVRDGRQASRIKQRLLENQTVE